MKLKLDAKTIAQLTLDNDEMEKFAWDSKLAGFGLRLRRRHDGSLLRTWTAQYRSSGHTRRFSLGSAEKVAVSKARDAARKVLAGAALGYDAQADKRSARARAQRTLRSAVDAYLGARQGALRSSSLRVLGLYLRGPYLKPLHSMGLGEIGHSDIAACLAGVGRRHSQNTVAEVRRALGALFTWALQEGWITGGNPVTNTRRPPRPASRDRVLSDAELVAIWRGCGDDDFGKIVRLLVLLGSRRQEIGSMTWTELDLDAGTWTLPASRSKNRRSHTVTLPRSAVGIVKAIPKRSADQLFGSLWGKHRGYTTWGHGKRALDARLPDLRPWRLHDIRRSVATGMAEIGVEPHVIEVTLNHHSGFRRGVAGTYNRASHTAAVITCVPASIPGNESVER